MAIKEVCSDIYAKGGFAPFSYNPFNLKYHFFSSVNLLCPKNNFQDVKNFLDTIIFHRFPNFIGDQEATLPFFYSTNMGFEQNVLMNLLLECNKKLSAKFGKLVGVEILLMAKNNSSFFVSFAGGMDILVLRRNHHFSLLGKTEEEGLPSMILCGEDNFMPQHRIFSYQKNDLYLLYPSFLMDYFSYEELIALYFKANGLLRDWFTLIKEISQEKKILRYYSLLGIKY